jgi:hypothetical protein
VFGLFALQSGLIDQIQLVAAIQAWTRGKSKSQADHLEARGDLTGSKLGLLEAMTGVHLEARGGEIENGPAAVPANSPNCARLAQLGEPEPGPR